jgi:subtilisin family serine protease
MRRHTINLMLGIGLLLLLAIPAEAEMPAFRPGELLVQFKTEARAAALNRSESSLGVRALRTLDNGRVHQLALPPQLSVSEALAIYQNDPDVVSAEPNYLLYAQSAPDDPYFDRQWGLFNTGQTVSGYTGTAGADIDAVAAWELATGSGTAVVAVVDTGCHLTHPDLAANIWRNAAEIADNGRDDDHNGYIDDVQGWDFADHDNYPQDATGHGTHVAGIIASRGDNGTGVTGIGWQVQIMPLRFMNAFDTGTVADAITAIEYAVANGARIINCSWGSSGYSIFLYNTIASADALFVCAAGNAGTDSDEEKFYPAGYRLDNILSVGASDQMDELAWFSNYGLQSVHVAAPGVRIYSLAMSWQNPWSESFDDDAMSGWTTGGTLDDWGVREAPGAAGTHVLSVTAEANYANNTGSWAISPPLDLSAARASKLTFQLIGASEAYCDYLYVELSSDLNSWSNLPLKVGNTIKYGGLSGSYPYWTTVTMDLGAWDGNSRLYIRFRFTSNASAPAAGFFIDNVILSVASDEEAYQYMSGTSMAAAFVSGVAALLQSQNQALTPQDLKSAILDGADRVAALADTSETGGRVNARKALNLIAASPDTDSSGSSGGGGGGGGGCFIGALGGSDR